MISIVLDPAIAFENRGPSLTTPEQVKLKGTSLTGNSMDFLRMDGKRGHVTCGNRLAIERQEAFQKFASFEEELLPYLGLVGLYKISHGLIWRKMTPAR